MDIKENVSYNQTVEACKLDAYFPENQTKETIVYFHGGGIVSGDKAEKNYVEIANRFASEGYGFVSVNYRMYPNAKFPDFLLDCAKAVSFVKTAFNKQNIIIAGQSAGAWMSLMLCFNQEYLKAENVDPKEIKAWIIDSAQTTAHFNVIKKEKGLHELSQVINEYAPLNYVNENTAFSKMLLIFYENDMPCRAEQNMLLYKNILAFNKDANIACKMLLGTHCSGSINKDDNGKYPYAETAIEWLSKND